MQNNDQFTGRFIWIAILLEIDIVGVASGVEMRNYYDSKINNNDGREKTAS